MKYTVNLIMQARSKIKFKVYYYKNITLRIVTNDVLQHKKRRVSKILIFVYILERHKITIYTIICLKSVRVRKLQVAILARSPREMSLTDRILPRYILSRVLVSVRPRIFLYAKNPKPELPASCLFQLIRSAAR